MKIRFDRKRFILYLWIQLAFTGLWLFAHLVTNPDTFFFRALNEFWRDIYLLAVNFVFYEYTWPYITKKRKYIIYNVLVGFFFIWMLMMLVSYGVHGWRQLGIAIGIYTSFRVDKTLEEALQYHAQGGFSSLFFFGIIRHIYDYTKLKQATQQLRIEKQEAELNYLKSQTNPHFLFNTLNNIYSLARDKSDLAPESLLRLSKILRYMLYEAGGEFIAVEQELKIMTDYIELEKLRYDESLRINFNYDVEDMKQALPPLLLIPLVENAFKHGVSETRGRPFVDIHLSIKQRQLSFTVKNSNEISLEERIVRENIGLSNLRRQLELLYKEYQLSVQPADGIFTASLKINLASHV
jgi:two-component system, LytTR family, sensor kinase